MNTVPPLARTNAEARVFLDFRSCQKCGKRDPNYRSSVVRVEGMLVSRYHGVCTRCQQEFEYDFRMPEQVLPPSDEVRFGGEEPSELLDPGVWLQYSDICSSQVPMDSSNLDERMRRFGEHVLATAVAAVDEVLKFIPPGADRVPESAFWSADSRAVYDQEPGRFARFRLEAVREAYADMLARW